MFALGLLAFLQMTFLPGWLILRLARLQTGWLQRLILGFALSLTANYVVIFPLAAAGLYLRPLVLILFAAECAAALWLSWPDLKAPLTQSASRLTAALAGQVERARQALAGLNRGTPDEQLAAWLRLLAGGVFAALALSALLWLAQVFANNLGTVFNTWDAVLSWNRWALDWAQNHLPVSTQYYPQLLPANWSLTYVFTGSLQVQFFAKAIMPLFMLFLLALLFDLGWDFKSFGYFIAIVICRYMLKKFLGEYISDGYADIPVTFFAFASVYTLLKARRATRPADLRASILLAGVLAGGAAVTKQPGVYLLACLPLLAWGLTAERPLLDARSRNQTILLALAAGLAIAVPWYVYKQIAIWQGLDESNVVYLTSTIHKIANPLERILPAIQSLEKYAVFVLLLVPLALLLDRTMKRLAFVVAAPYTLIWAAFVSYETRNLALAIPFIALVCGLGLERIYNLLVQWGIRLQAGRLRLVYLALAAAALLASTSWWVKGPALVERQITLQKQTFGASLNEKLYDYIEQHGTQMRILTNYPVAYLPGLEKMQVSFFFNDFAAYDTARQDAGVTHILLPPFARDDIKEDIAQRIDRGEYQVIFEDSSYGTYTFIKIR